MGKGGKGSNDNNADKDRVNRWRPAISKGDGDGKAEGMCKRHARVIAEGMGEAPTEKSKPAGLATDDVERESNDPKEQDGGDGDAEKDEMQGDKALGGSLGPDAEDVRSGGKGDTVEAAQRLMGDRSEERGPDKEEGMDDGMGARRRWRRRGWGDGWCGRGVKVGGVDVSTIGVGRVGRVSGGFVAA